MAAAEDGGGWRWRGLCPLWRQRRRGEFSGRRNAAQGFLRPATGLAGLGPCRWRALPASSLAESRALPSRSLLRTAGLAVMPALPHCRPCRTAGLTVIQALPSCRPCRALAKAIKALKMTNIAPWISPRGCKYSLFPCHMQLGIRGARTEGMTLIRQCNTKNEDRKPYDPNWTRRCYWSYWITSRSQVFCVDQKQCMRQGGGAA